ncbi:hypothetical protein RF11_03987 [Thelohanellus kitauei]|uniref:RING-type domain-containing protein n=1 Tax=Thelohanellus kitauei TaxID=669202 RepID=A0A0C2MGD4_THEKT|nr:hypothetical protein RF11_03987 [Thelohanellus kitauei]
MKIYYNSPNNIVGMINDNQEDRPDPPNENHESLKYKKNPDMKGSPFCIMCFSDQQLKEVKPCGNGPFCYNCATRFVEIDKKCPICSSEVVSAAFKEMLHPSSFIDNLR